MRFCAAACSRPRLFSVPIPAWTHAAPGFAGAAEAGAAARPTLTAAAAVTTAIFLNMGAPEPVSLDPGRPGPHPHYAASALRGCTRAPTGLDSGPSEGLHYLRSLDPEDVPWTPSSPPTSAA